MSNKSIWITAGGCALLLAVAAAVVWLSRPAGHADCVPARAKAVLAVSPAQLGGEGAAGLRQALGSLPDGLDLSRDIYAFVTPNEYIGLAAAVGDGGALARSFAEMERKGRCGKVEEDGRRHWAWLKAGWLVAWDSRKLLALGPGVPQERDALRLCLSRMMDGREERFLDTADGERMNRGRGGVRLYAALDALPAPYNFLFRLEVPPGCPLSAIHLHAATETEPGGKPARVTCALVCTDSAAARRLDSYERNRGCIAPPSGTGKDEDGRPLFRFVTRTKGADFLTRLRSDATLRGLLLGLNQTIDADKMLRSADGVLEMTVGRLAKDWTPSFCLRTENTAENLFAGEACWAESAARQKEITLRRTAPEAFVLKDREKGSLFFGRNKGGLLYFASSGMETYADTAPLQTGKRPYSPDGLLTYFRLDTELLWRQPCMEGGTAALLRALLPAKRAVTGRRYAGRRMELTFE